MRRLRRRRRLSTHDRVGLGWRPELAAGILANLHAIDVVEVLADDYADAGRAALRSLRTLARQLPVLVHAVGLGLASCSPVDERRLAGIARVVHGVEPELWSEHLAFVRAGGREIGHLTAPSRTRATVEGAAVNLARAQRVVGALPHVENVATLVDPPGSDMDEPAWICAVLAAAGSRLLLDLHNLHANAVNFGFDARRSLARLPLERVEVLHLAGGRWIDAGAGERRLLDDHLHRIPAPVFDLLEEVGARSERPLSVIVERDGAYPAIEALLAELGSVRAALARGRARRPPVPA